MMHEGDYSTIAPFFSGIIVQSCTLFFSLWFRKCVVMFYKWERVLVLSPVAFIQPVFFSKFSRDVFIEPMCMIQQHRVQCL